jgi:hypothetical protein
MEDAGNVVGNDAFITLDVEAILDADLRPLIDRASAS